LHVPQEGLAPVEQALSSFGQCDASRCPVEQSLPDLVLHPPYLKAHLGPRNAQAHGGRREAAELSDGDEASQQIEVMQGLAHDLSFCVTRQLSFVWFI
jgi:hypothetical protein